MPPGSTRAGLTEARRRCLQWYEDTRSSKTPIPVNPGWNARQVEWLLDQGFLHVGREGWHVPTPTGRLALQESSE